VTDRAPVVVELVAFSNHIGTNSEEVLQCLSGLLAAGLSRPERDGSAFAVARGESVVRGFGGIQVRQVGAVEEIAVSSDPDVLSAKPSAQQKTEFPTSAAAGQISRYDRNGRDLR
jgi:hypothetical protein